MGGLFQAGVLLVTVIVPLCLPRIGMAQASGGEAGGHAAAPVARALRVTEPITVDGRLEEAAWAAAPVLTEFTQLEPRESAPVSERTEVCILFSGDALYMGAKLYDREAVSRRLARRDAPLIDSDWFAIALDSYHDHLTAFRFAINPAGVRRDEVLSGGGGGQGRRGGRGEGDDSWDPVWEGNAVVTDSGWVAEMRIPFSQLRFSRADVQTWGVQIERRISRRQEHAVFAFTSRRERSGVARYGHLTGIEGIRASRRLEVLPYAVAQAQYRHIASNTAVDFPDPYRTGSDYGAGAGLDVKYRVSPNFTLDATVNPDFGQVEVDPAEVNLTAFETRFQEKRPFFVEGAEIFRFGGGGGGGDGGGGEGGGTPQLLYSRRIGRAPQGSVPQEAVYASAPTASTILGAAKLTGRTAGGWSVGLLNAVTAREDAPYVDALGFQRRAVVEPFSNYFSPGGSGEIYARGKPP